MHPDPETAPKTRDCKIKPVYPAFRYVSTPRRTKDLPVVGPVDPEGALGMAEGSASATEWSAERVSERLRMELTPRAWSRLVREPRAPASASSSSSGRCSRRSHEPPCA